MVEASSIVRSEVGRGTVCNGREQALPISVGFGATAPLADLIPNGPHSDRSPCTSDPALSTILVVEDSPAVQEALMRALQHPGIQILTASSAEEALVALEGFWVDMVIADWRLPDCSGIDLLERIRGQQPSIVRVLITGQRNFGLMREAINRAGVTFFLSKPWDQRSLGELLRCLPGRAGEDRGAGGDRDGGSQGRGSGRSDAAGGSGGRVDTLLAAVAVSRDREQVLESVCRSLDEIGDVEEVWFADDTRHVFEIRSGTGALSSQRGLDTIGPAEYRFVVETRMALGARLLEVELAADGRDGRKRTVIGCPLRQRGRDLGLIGVALTHAEAPARSELTEVLDHCALGIAAALYRVASRDGRDDLEAAARMATQMLQPLDQVGSALEALRGIDALDEEHKALVARLGEQSRRLRKMVERLGYGVRARDARV